ncbi:MAG: MFS transporter [Odoribacteraceae bacterium]|jgi:PAT family beta-lactamase induction signal transducer AmpG|nr:MFS transporter [Odoribacteraceae bacterium]
MKPWSWIPSLYFAQGLPNAIVVTLSVVLYKRLGLSNAEIAFYTGWLHLPWVIKPLWSPVVEMLGTKRRWIVVAQFLTGAALAGVALSIPASGAVRYTLVFLWLVAFSSATHDIAADGFYMLGLDERRQAFFVGWRNTFYRVAMLAGQGGAVVLAGFLEDRYTRSSAGGGIHAAWSVTFLLLAALLLLLALYHAFFLPRPRRDVPPVAGERRGFLETFISFFRSPGILPALAFLLLFRFSEAQLSKIAPPFLLDDLSRGGLGMTTAGYGLAYGTVGLLALTTGGITGGVLLSRLGFRRCIWWMTLAMNLPNLVYVYLSLSRPAETWLISSCVAVEQFGYGFGFTAYTLFMILFSDGPGRTARYALCTGFMALGLMLPGMFSGWVQEATGYPVFFLWIMLCTIPCFIVARAVRRFADCRG